MKEIKNLIASMTPGIYQRLMQAVELGKWANGTPLTLEQREYSLQAVMLWQSVNNKDPQHISIGTDGHIVIKGKQELKQQFINVQQQR